MKALSRILFALVGSCVVSPGTLAQTLGFPYGSEKVRGVNLGGWLVLEVSFRET